MLLSLALPFLFAIAAAIAYEKGGTSWLWGAFAAGLAGIFFLSGGSLLSVALFALPLFVIAISISGSPRTGDPFSHALRGFFAGGVTMLLMFLASLVLVRFIKLPF